MHVTYFMGTMGEVHADNIQSGCTLVNLEHVGTGHDDCTFAKNIDLLNGVCLRTFDTTTISSLEALLKTKATAARSHGMIRKPDWHTPMVPMMEVRR